MEQITMKDTELVGGAGLFGWIGSQIIGLTTNYVGGLVMSGQIDYSGVAEEQGHYYNTVGA